MASKLDSPTKDNFISEVLDKFVSRPLFVNYFHTSSGTTLTDITTFLQPEMQYYQPEVVGSSADGLKVGKVFDVGDIDIIFYSNTLEFTQEDENQFEYKEESPCFFHVRRPAILSHLKAVDGKYLNPNDLRNKHPALFRPPSDRPYTYIPFPLVYQNVTQGDTGCATTFDLPYSDPVPGLNTAESRLPVETRRLESWTMENALLGYLINKSNNEKMRFVRDMLYGTETVSCEDIEHNDSQSMLENTLTMWKQDFQRCMLSLSDLIYFFGEEFQQLLDVAIDKDQIENIKLPSTREPHGSFSSDLVPAIRCKGWPRPAESFRTRTRKWPDQNAIDDIISKGFQVVAKASPRNPIPNKDFILSFSPAEKQISNLLPTGAKMAYCLLKLCYKSAEKQLPKETLKTFHLKTALFWVAEKTEPTLWEENGLLHGLRSLTAFLIESLLEQNLPSYFVSSNNLISHLSPDEISSTLEVFIAIQENPTNYIYIGIKMEKEFTLYTTNPESFRELMEPGYLESVSWENLIKFYCHGIGVRGDKLIEEHMENPQLCKSPGFLDQFTTAMFRETSDRRFLPTTSITDEQLMYVDIFIQTASQLDLNLFNVIEEEVEGDIIQSSRKIQVLSEETLKFYPHYNQEADDRFGDYFNALTKLRLKIYANILHMLSVKLIAFEVTGMGGVKNEDALYIMKFLTELKKRRNFNDENVQDLLHFMLYFCQLTRLRHHRLSPDEQILRSMREFLQNAKDMMTVYFNPRDLYPPKPVDVGDRIVKILGECFLPTKQTTRPASIDLD